MGTFLKYVFYLALIIIIYLVGKGIFEGQITQKTTVGEVVDNVESGTKNLVKEGKDAAETAVENYKEAPKEDVEIGTGSAVAK